MRIPLTTRLPPDDDVTREFKCAIGRLIYTFADIERVMFYSLITSAQMPIKIAKAVFTDAKIDKVKQHITRLRLARGLPDDAFLDDTFTQIGHITRLRNDIAHYGAVYESGAKFKVSDELWKLETARVYFVTACDIDDAISDLMIIRQRLALYMISGWVADGTTEDRPAPFPWRHKPFQPTRSPKSSRPKSPKQPRQRPSSRESQ
jgi:hypothetical protein